MNNKLSQIPFLRLIFPLVVGIFLALYFPSRSLLFYVVTSCSFVGLITWYWHSNKYYNFSTRWIFGALVGLFLVITGYSLTILKRPFQDHAYFERYLDDKNDSLVITVLSPPQEKEKTMKTTAEVRGVIMNGRITSTNGKALFYFEKDSLAETIKYGDELVVHAYMEAIRPPMNPDEFDYKNYLIMHGIYREAYIRNGAYFFTGKNNASWLTGFTNRCRQNLISLLDNRIKGNEAAVASAILLGYRDDLSQSVIQQFADSGTVHVICVAGLHVGILFWLLGLLLLPLERLSHGKLLRTVLLVLLLWLYALFTGMATPVLRATVMFSFLIVGRHFGKYTNSINTLAMSAFLMLLFNPFAIADTSFQLSYISVLGIIVMFPTLKGVFNFRYFLIEKTWELACLSISAQLAIAPLSLLYFHQFPNYFVFTNLLVVPLLSVVIYAGVLFFITAHIPYILIATTWVLQKSLFLMNGLVSRAPHLPFFVTKGISISIPEAILLYLVLLSVLAFVINKKYASLFIALSCFTIFLGTRTWKNYTTAHQEVFAVYDIPKHSAVAFISGRQCRLTQPIDSLDFCYHLQYNWWDKEISDSISLNKDTSVILLNGHLWLEHNYAQFNHLRIAFADNNAAPQAIEKLKVQYLVVSGNYRKNITDLQNAFIFDKLIFDSSVSSYRLKKWEPECKQLNIPYYDVNKQGAFIESCEL